MSPTAIDVSGVSKRFRITNDRRTHLKEVFVRGRSQKEEFWALRDVSLTVAAGSTYGLIGHNGSGKSTLLKLMAGIHRPTSGSISHHGRISALLELGAGFHPELTGRENIYLNGSILGIRGPVIDRALDRIVEFSGLGPFIDSPVKVYSSGMYARLGFSIAVHLDPEILIVDEILAVGDEDFQRRCFDYLEQLRSRGVTIVFVSHSLGIVQKLCDQVAWLDHGVLRMVGDTMGVVEAYIESVNEIESARIEQLAPAEPREPGSSGQVRRGSGEIRVTDVSFLRHGSSVPQAVSGEPLTIRIEYRAVVPVECPVFAVGIYGEHGNKIATPHTTSMDLGTLEGDGFVDLSMDPLLLQQGTWRLSIGVTNRSYTTTYDHQEKAVTLKVQASGRSIDLGGDVALPVSWSHSRS